MFDFSKKHISRAAPWCRRPPSINLQMKNIWFRTWFCNLWGNFVIFGEQFCHFFRIWASLRWWREARIRRKCEKIETHKQMNATNHYIFCKNLNCSLCFFVGFWKSLGECFFLRFGGQSVPNRDYEHVCSYITAKLESWKLVFRLHQTLLFRVLRGWVGTSWVTFSNIFSGMGLESLSHYIFFEKVRVQA